MPANDLAITCGRCRRPRGAEPHTKCSDQRNADVMKDAPPSGFQGSDLDHRSAQCRSVDRSLFVRIDRVAGVACGHDVSARPSVRVACRVYESISGDTRDIVAQDSSVASGRGRVCPHTIARSSTRNRRDTARVHQVAHGPAARSDREGTWRSDKGTQTAGAEAVRAESGQDDGHTAWDEVLRQVGGGRTDAELDVCAYSPFEKERDSHNCWTNKGVRLTAPHGHFKSVVSSPPITRSVSCFSSN